MSRDHTASRKRIKLEHDSDSGDDDKKRLAADPAHALQYGPVPSNEELMHRQRHHAGQIAPPGTMYYGAPPPPFPGPMYYAVPPGPMYYAPPPPPMPPPMPMYQPHHTVPPPTIPFEDMSAALEPHTLRNLVNYLALHDPSGLARYVLTDAYNFQIQSQATAQHTEQKDDFDFEEYSKEAWHVLNTSHYTELKSSKQYEVSFDAFQEVKECIEAIAEQTDADASFRTKLSALETLRKIGKTIILSDGDCLPSEVRKRFQGDPCLPDAMREILSTMGEDECLRAGRNVLDVGKGALLDKTEWLSRQWKSYCLDGEESFDAVLEALGYDFVKSEEDSD